VKYKGVDVKQNVLFMPWFQ